MDQHSSPKSVEVSKELEGVCEKIARSRKVSFLKAASVVRCCEADQEHMNAGGHAVFAEAVYEKLLQMAS